LLIVAGIGGLTTVGLCLRKQARLGIALIPLLVALLLAIVNLEILPSADSRLSARAAAQDALRLNPSGRNILVFGLSRDWNYGMDYYFGYELPEWTSGATLPEWVVTTKGNAAIPERFANQFKVVSQVGEPFAVVIHVTPATGKLP
jgi:hypothetical protein